ncbi:Thioesterase-like superfamily protein [compost metagenome]
MTPIHQILSAAHPIAGGFRAEIPTDWLQGRTAYGGLSSALALHAAQTIEPDLPPLRSAQVSFIGPLSGAVTVTATKLRRGRTAAFIQADIVSEAGLGYRATFVFMAEQPSRIALSGALHRTVTPPAADATLYTGPDDFFTGNFNFLDLKDQAPGEAE